MGTAALAWSLLVECLRQWSRRIYRTYFLEHMYLYDKHLFFQYISLKTHTSCTISTAIPIHSAQFRTFAVFCPSVMYIFSASVYVPGFTIPVFPFLEAVKLLCAVLRSAGRSVGVLRTAARLVLGPFLPCHRRP